MASIKDQQLLYHLTSLANLGSIFDKGLQPRSALSDFYDVADAEILTSRKSQGLDDYVPFHWFARNPFDGRVQQDRPDEDFVLITVRRSVARGRNWKVISRHPLAKEAPELLDYAAGFDLIDWVTMDARDYKDTNGKSVCMAECLSPNAVAVADFFMIYVRTEKAEGVVTGEIERRSLSLGVTVNGNMFNK